MTADPHRTPAPSRPDHTLEDPMAITTTDHRTPFLSVTQAADELAVTERFIRKLIADGQLRAVKVGTRVIRIRRTDLDDLLRPARVIPRLGRR